MPVFRVEKKRNFTIMSNHHLQNPNLSLKAKGLLSLMLSLPDNWDYTLKGLATLCKDGIDSIRNALTELEEQCYMMRRRVRNEYGRFGGMEYLIYENPIEAETFALDSPILEKPIQVNPMQEKPMLDNPTQLNTNIQNTYKQNTKRQRTEGNDSGVVLSYPSIRTGATRNGAGKPADTMDGYDKTTRCRKAIRERIEISFWTTSLSQSCLNKAVSLTADVPCSRYKNTRMGYANNPVVGLIRLIFAHYADITTNHPECRGSVSIKGQNIHTNMLSPLNSISMAHADGLQMGFIHSTHTVANRFKRSGNLHAFIRANTAFVPP